MRRTITLSLAAGLLLSLSTAAFAELTPLERLGKSLFFDPIASPDRQACADCHGPAVGFTGPISNVNKHGAVMSGAITTRFGNRKPPSAAYATQSPILHWDTTDELFLGGNFWDGRATGEKLGNPAADQALGPFLNPVEMNNPDKKSVLQQIAGAPYAGLWAQVFGGPIKLNNTNLVDREYDRIGLAIAAFEASSEVNPFSSKFDYVEKGQAKFTPAEAWGKELFESKANCAACHMAPLFTDFSYDNIGTPKNQENPFYSMDQVFLGNGQPINPLGRNWVDPGLGGFLSTLPDAFFTALGLDKATQVAENLGKMKVPTLRNIDKRPNAGFGKAYMHNGALKSLKEVVHFYNTRDVEPWPAPEQLQNVNHDELGNLGLTSAEEDAVVAFLKTLSDGFEPRGAALPAALATTGDDATDPVGLHVRYLAPGRYQFAYALPVAGTVNVSLFDVAGREVGTLVDGPQAAGSHVVDWSSRSLPQGIYLVNLRAGATQLTQKVLVSR
jgi:cytochrome c peroxidase